MEEFISNFKEFREWLFFKQKDLSTSDNVEGHKVINEVIDKLKFFKLQNSF